LVVGRQINVMLRVSRSITFLSQHNTSANLAVQYPLGNRYSPRAMRLHFLTVLLFAWPAQAAADSDGYFCHGAGYLAWETRLGTATAEHILHIVRFDHASGILPTERVILPDFQVHSMTCGSALVELAGWTTTYRVELLSRPVVTSRALQFDATKWPVPGNLGYGGRSGITDLEADGRTGEFELVVARVSRQVRGGGGIDHHVVARLVQRELSPSLRVVASRVLMEGIYRESVDDD
jgi:hypothetical protein